MLSSSMIYGIYVSAICLVIKDHVIGFYRQHPNLRISSLWVLRTISGRLDKYPHQARERETRRYLLSIRELNTVRKSDYTKGLDLLDRERHRREFLSMFLSPMIGRSIKPSVHSRAHTSKRDSRSIRVDISRKFQQVLIGINNRLPD